MSPLDVAVSAAQSWQFQFETKPKGLDLGWKKRSIFEAADLYWVKQHNCQRLWANWELCFFFFLSPAYFVCPNSCMLSNEILSPPDRWSRTAPRHQPNVCPISTSSESCQNTGKGPRILAVTSGALLFSVQDSCHLVESLAPSAETQAWKHYLQRCSFICTETLRATCPVWTAKHDGAREMQRGTKKRICSQENWSSPSPRFSIVGYLSGINSRQREWIVINISLNFYFSSLSVRVPHAELIIVQSPLESRDGHLNVYAEKSQVACHHFRHNAVRLEKHITRRTALPVFTFCWRGGRSSARLPILVWLFHLL